MMRKTGKTTRLIDETIQKLFNDGEVFIRASKKLHSDDFRGTFVEMKDIIQDPDWSEGIANNMFVDKLIQRLKLEHEGMYNIVYKGRWFVIETKIII